jgi:hypothetical protein
MRNQLEEAILFQVIKAAGFPQTKFSRLIYWSIFGSAIKKFSNLAQGFDDEIKMRGSISGVRWLLPHFVEKYESSGSERIPGKGPLLLVANHPGSVDGLVIAALLNRLDLKIVISDIPIFRLFTNISQHIIFSPPVADIRGRMQTIRESIQHLKDGGALLIFPRGKLEPDPYFMPGLESSFPLWSRSLEIFLRKVPKVKVMVCLAGGVIAKSCMDHPITWFRKGGSDKQRLAMIYQLSRQVLGGRERYGLKPQVVFSEPISLGNQESTGLKINEMAMLSLKEYYDMQNPEM